MNRQGKGTLPGLVFLALCFLGGVVLGQVLAARVPDSTGQELTAYLRQFVQLEGGDVPVWSTLVLYFRYPLLAALLGFSSVGVVLLPCAAVAFGLSLSFSVCCFTAAFGPDGVLLALAVFGLRCAVTLPVFFLLAVPSWRAAVALASLSFGRGRRAAPVTYGKDWWRRLALCGIALLAGMCVDLFCSPWLLRLVLERILGFA
jgi:stage II sporulation protein M